jgi:hypothetical protein
MDREVSFFHAGAFFLRILYITADVHARVFTSAIIIIIVVGKFAVTKG